MTDWDLVQFKVNGKVIPGTKDNLQVFVDCPSKAPPRMNVMAGANQSFNIGFTPDEAGLYLNQSFLFVFNLIRTILGRFCISW